MSAEQFPILPQPEAYKDWQEWGHALIGTLTVERDLESGTPFVLAHYGVASVPRAVRSGVILYIPDESGGAVPAFSDGVNWRRVTDRAIIS